MAEWDAAIKADTDGTSRLQRELGRIVEELAQEHSLVVTRSIEPGYKQELTIIYEIQPLGYKTWLLTDQIDVSDGDGHDRINLKYFRLFTGWTVPSDFITDFRQALSSLLTDGVFEFRNRRATAEADLARAEERTSCGCLLLLAVLSVLLVFAVIFLLGLIDELVW